jgi:hypothetical protein
LPKPVVVKKFQTQSRYPLAGIALVPGNRRDDKKTILADSTLQAATDHQISAPVTRGACSQVGAAGLRGGQ